MKNGPDNNTEIQNIDRSVIIENTIRQYANMIYRIAYQNTGNFHDAEDILQEVSITLVTADAPITDPQHIKPWLIRVTINKCRDLCRRRKRMKTEPLEDHLDIPADEKPAITEELLQLPDLYRNILYLYYYENLNIREISEALHKNMNTIRSGLQRGRKKFKEILTKEAQG